MTAGIIGLGTIGTFLGASAGTTALGATIGSFIVPGAGTLVGGVIGGIIGGIGLGVTGTLIGKKIQKKHQPQEDSFLTKEVKEYYRPLIISGPSGVGKGTIIGELRRKYPTKFGFSISYTTRNKRGKEVNGVDYHFTDLDTMKSDIESGKFIEYADVFGNYYGHTTESIESVMKEGKCCIIDIDVQGAQKIKSKMDQINNPLFIFINAPSIEDLEKRLKGRGTETEEQIRKRVATSKYEIEIGTKKEGNIYDFIVVNDNLEETIKSIEAIIDKNIFNL